ncbi:hypothetical protein ACHAWO_004249 [Cyclotella atomus]|uniref:Uncharacterized protein n=1 Tax=Cyclotella atomus TaxID=382360 RepID=A0ABD3NM43_9STRA
MNIQEHRQKLLNRAASHGPYLWRSADVQNALLWFSAPRADSGNAAVDGSEDAVDNVEFGGCEFLRHLLHSPGIHVTNRKKKLREQKKDDGKSGETAAAVGKKRKREKTDQSSKSYRTDEVLSSVLKGYYQLYLPWQAVAHNGNSRMQLGDEDSMHKDDASSQNPSDEKDTIDSYDIEMASAELQHALNTIILSKLRTQELHKAALIRIKQTKDAINNVPEGLQMSVLIDEYMTHPNTAILRAYTSNIYDRYQSLTGDGRDRFIRKLLATSNSNARIQQVVLLFLLEPLRRLYVQSLQKSMEKTALVQSEYAHEQTKMHEELKSKISLYPLLTSDKFFIDISAEKIEAVCSLEPMQQIIEFILQEAPNNLEIEAGNVSWWSSPSPLLCFASQLHFPIACGYIQFWVKTAIDAHEKLYLVDSKRRSKPQSNPLHCASTINSNSEYSFESVVFRIRQFIQTSQRLEDLTDYVMSVMEEESYSNLEKDTNNAEDGGDYVSDDAAFRIKLTWNAIRRGVKSSL